MKVEQVFDNCEDKLIISPENNEECADLLDCFQENDTFVGEYKRDLDYKYPHLILRKDFT